MADLIDNLIGIAVAVIVYFSIFAAIVTAVATTNWTALSLTWVPTVIYIMLAVLPIVGIVAYFKSKTQ